MKYGVSQDFYNYVKTNYPKLFEKGDMPRYMRILFLYLCFSTFKESEENNQDNNIRTVIPKDELCELFGVHYDEKYKYKHFTIRKCLDAYKGIFPDFA